MNQVLTTSASGQMTSAGTSVTTMDSVPARLVYFYTPTTNAGTVTITSLGGTYGVVKNAGEDFPPMWIDNLNKLAYITSNSGDKLNYLVMR